MTVVVILVLCALPWVVLILAIPYNARTPSETDFSKSAQLAKPPAPLAKEVTLKIVTFNIHDLYLISRERPERMRGIGETLRALDPDIAGFQEAWIERDRQTLLSALVGSRLTYDRYFPSGTVGSGLFIASAYPIAEAFFHRYEKNGKWYKPYHGDWWGGKGAALVRIELPDGVGYVDFYDTHAHAGYGSHEYDADREHQMQELADFVHATAVKTSPALLVGDFNCRAGSKAFQIVADQAKLQWLMEGDPRIDNILAVKNPHYTFELVDLLTIDRKIPLPAGETRLSDHNGYMSTIRIKPVSP
jgi:sphingomyelin phosphodiesterase 2